MSTTNHTPIPWAITRWQEEWEKTPTISIHHSADGFSKSWVAHLTEGVTYHDKTEANAEFIVRACNSHESLLDALKKCEGTIGALSRLEKDPIRKRLLWSVTEGVRAAIEEASK